MVIEEHLFIFPGEITPTKNFVVGIVIFLPHAEKDKADAHERSEEIYYALREKGKFILDDKEYNIEKGTMIYIGPGA